jgi:hypothetical protein
MGIGGPPRPTGSTELIALSPGLMNVSKDVKAPASDFPEPPPPPPLEELNADDWEIAETPPLPKPDASPESVDDFIEELPPSVPQPADDEPTALIPARQLLQTAKLPADDILSAMTARSGGVTPEGGAPSIDVSELAAAAAPQTPKSVDLTQIDVPLHGTKNTLPLFALDDGHAATFPSPPKAPAGRPRPPQPTVSPAEGSLSPASLDPPPSADRPDSVRTRKNVVAPATKSVPPAAGERRRSVLSIPILGGLAIAAGVLIWQRGVVSPPITTAQSERSTPAAEKPTPVAATEPPAAVATISPSAPVEAPDDMTFETAPTAAAPKSAAPTHHEPSVVAPEGESKPPPSSKQASPTTPAPAAPASEPEPAVAKNEPKPHTPEPAVPSGPVGDFDPGAAAAALTAGAAQASACRKDGDPSGVASVVVTFAPSGRVTSANISGPPFAGTPTGGCIAAALRKARVPAFEGDRVTVSKTIVIQ